MVKNYVKTVKIGQDRLWLFQRYYINNDLRDLLKFTPKLHFRKLIFKFS